MENAQIKANWRQAESPESAAVLPPAFLAGVPRGQVLYLYFDESGNFDFRESGTPYIEKRGQSRLAPSRPPHLSISRRASWLVSTGRNLFKDITPETMAEFQRRPHKPPLKHR